MDIQVSSTFERVLFEAYGRDGTAVRRLMSSLAQSRSFTIDEAPLAAIRREFSAVAVPETDVAAEMAATWKDAGYLLDPHTAIGVAGARKLLAGDASTPAIVLGTAHPAKFPDAVKAATGVHPRLPAHLADLHERKERYTVLPNDLAEVERFVRDRARAGKASTTNSGAAA
jgi:threonine synthase